MRAMRLHKINEFTLDQVEKPVPKGDEILVKVGACGICGSDIPRVYELGTKVYPVTLGHEYSGTVVEVGNPEDSNLIGRTAAIYPVVPCNECPSCKIGQYAQCSNYRNLGSRTDGGFAEYCLLPSKWHLVFSQNEETSKDDLALVEPATVALHAIRKGEVLGGNQVMIFGAGPIGILAARWCKLFGAHPILVDINPQAIAFAKERGFVVRNSLDSDFIEQIIEETKGKMIDVVIEGTGTSSALNLGIECCKPYGMITLLGNPHTDTTITLNEHSNILRKELKFTGVWNNYYNDLPFNEWEYTVQMMDENKLKVSDLITHRSDLEHLKELFDRIYNKEINVCKAVYTTEI
ncbi:MAG: galactitol-1-phosphate 5-dehydrogenase [Anaerostipes sp.]|jgi:L-iditol 2-dehydrogenase